MQGTLEPSLIENGLAFGELLWLGAVIIIFVAALYVVLKFIQIIRREV